MSTATNQIGLNAKKAAGLSKKLNILLANYQLFYINTRGFHWNIKGENFFELHLKFEEIYNDTAIKIDEIAERILTLGYTPFHSFSEYLKHADIKEATNVSSGKKGLEHLVEGYKILIKLERIILLDSAEMNDEGTNALMSDYIRQQEKTVWMLTSYLK